MRLGQVGQNGRTITEVEVDEYLTGKRRAQAGFVDTSFPTIAGAGPNGAIIHYRAQSGSCATVDNKTLLLVDSGEHPARSVRWGARSQAKQGIPAGVKQRHWASIALQPGLYSSGSVALQSVWHAAYCTVSYEPRNDGVHQLWAEAKSKLWRLRLRTGLSLPCILAADDVYCAFFGRHCWAYAPVEAVANKLQQYSLPSAGLSPCRRPV